MCMGTLLSGCAHDDLGFASGLPSGWVNSAYYYISAGSSKPQDLGCELDAVVNQKPPVKRRIREFWRDDLGSGPNPHGWTRTPDSQIRNGESAGGGEISCNSLGATRYEEAPTTLVAGALR